MEPSAPPMPSPYALVPQVNYVDKFQNHLDRYLPIDGSKCELFKCVPGWIWLVGAGLSVAAAASRGWSTLLKTIVWEAVVGWGVAWLCRGCHTRILWFLIIIGTVLPLAIIFGAMFLIGESAVAASGGCQSCQKL